MGNLEVVEAVTPSIQTAKKLTSDRLALVEEIQGKMRVVAGDLARLIEQEENGWQPGSPRPTSMGRVPPLEKILAETDNGVAMLEVLYS